MNQLGTNLLKVLPLTEDTPQDNILDTFSTFTYPFLSADEVMNPFFQLNAHGQEINVL
jgi:hypothetical protein